MGDRSEIGKSASPGRVMALDVGDRRIGVSVSDELRMTAQGVMTIHRTSWTDDLATIAGLVEEWRAECVLVGWPLTLKGEIGPRTKIVAHFIKRLESAVTVPIRKWDERFTTAMAERVLIEADMSRANRRNVIDKTSAVVILQGYLSAGSPVRTDDGS